MTNAKGEVLSTDILSERGMHDFPGIPAAKAALPPGLERLALIAVKRDGEAHVLHSLFSVPVRPYRPERRLFVCQGELPLEGLPLIIDIPTPSFAVRRIFSALLW